MVLLKVKVRVYRSSEMTGNVKMQSSVVKRWFIKWFVPIWMV